MTKFHITLEDKTGGWREGVEAVDVDVFGFITGKIKIKRGGA